MRCRNGIVVRARPRGPSGSGVGRVHWPSAAAATVLLGLAASAFGDAPDTSEWLCESCPFQSGYRGDYTAGATTVSEDSAHFGSGSGYDESGVYLNVDGEGSYIGDEYRLQWRIDDLGLDSRAVSLEGGRPGTYGYALTWRDLPYRRFDTTRSVFSPSGGDDLALPSDWVRAPVTTAMTGLSAALAGSRIESDRRVIGLGGDAVFGGGVEVFANVERQQNEGRTFTAGAGFTSAAQLPRPFDYETDRVDLGVRYRGERSQLSLAWYGSYFAPASAGYAWDNPFTVVAGAETSVSAQPPENSYQQLSASGSYRFNQWDLVGGFLAAVGRGEQDEAFVPYTSNASIEAGALPRGDLGGDVDTTKLALTLSARPHPRFRARMAYRYDDRDNQTPVATYERVIVDGFLSGEAEQNTPYSFERNAFDLRGDFDVTSELKLAAAYEFRRLDRSLQEVSEQDEDTGWVMLRYRPRPGIDVRARAGTSKREIDRYDTDLAVAQGQNPLLRKYNLAHRYREFGELVVTASHAELPLSASVTFARTDDDYTRSRLGVLDGTEERLAADLTWAFSDKGTVYVLAGYDELTSRQAGSAGLGEPDWAARNDDDFDTIGAGLRLDGIGDHTVVSLDYVHAEGTGRISLGSGAGAFDRFPDITSELDSVRLRLSYRRSERLTIDATLRLEMFESRDWALDGVAPDTVPTLLALGAEPYDYDVVLFGLGFRYALGEQANDIELR